MAALASVAAGLQAAMLLARGRADGLRYVEQGLDGARRSFWAAAICLPFFVVLHLQTWTGAAGPAHASALDLLGYVTAWAGFALISRPVVAWMGRAGRWPRFIAAWNWCNVAQYVLLVAAAVPGWLAAPGWVQQAAGLIAVGWALWLEWYAARLTLDVGPLAAAALTGLDMLLGVVLASLIAALPPG